MTLAPLDPLRVPLNGVRRIEASAGTGKTYAITALFVRLVVERNLDVSQILVVTFTRAATDELRDRIRAGLRTALRAIAGSAPAPDPFYAQFAARHAGSSAALAALRAALANLDRAAIFTIHGFCQRALSDHAIESGVAFDTAVVADEQPLLAEVVADFWVSRLYAAPPALIARLQAGGEPRARLAELARTVLARPDVHVVPGRSPDLLEPSLAAFGAAWQAAAALFQAPGARERIRETLEAALRGRVLDGRRYRAASLGPWMLRLADVFAAPDPLRLERFEAFEKFTPAGLLAATRAPHPPPCDPFFEACGSLHEAHQQLDVALAAAVRNVYADFVAFARREVPRRNAALRQQGFDDLLLGLGQALAGPGGPRLAKALRARYHAALVDEFQDTDPLQYDILRRVFGEAPEGALFLIGDPKQAIYGFRGADVFAYLAAAADAGAEAYGLLHNWRSDPRLVRATSTLFERLAEPFLVADIAFQPVAPAAPCDRLQGLADGAALDVLFVSRATAGVPSGARIPKAWADAQLPRLVAAEVVRLLRSPARLADKPPAAGGPGRALDPGDVAVLVRKNAQALDVQGALRAHGLPSTLATQASVFETPEAADLRLVLAALAEPQRAAPLRAALATAFFGYDAAALLRLHTDEVAADAEAERFRRWHELWQASGFIAAFRRLLDEGEVSARLLGHPDGERRLTNVLHLCELLHRASVDYRLGPTGLSTWLGELCADPARAAALGSEATQMRLESDARAVHVVTVHRSKGLEYPIVFLPYLWDGRLQLPGAADPLLFHDETAARRLTLDLGSAERAAHEAQAAAEAQAENVRLLYVALTRAKHRCTVVWGAFQDAHTSALGWLLHGRPPAAPAGLGFAAAAARLAELPDATLDSELAALRAESGGAIGVRHASLDPEPAWRPPPGPAVELACRVPRRRVFPAWGLTSFSALVAERGRLSPSDTGPAAPGADDAPVPDAGAHPPPSALAPVALRPADALTLADFPRGAAAGTLLHALFETYDFALRDPDARRTHVRAGLARAAAAEGWVEPLCTLLDDVAAVSLDGRNPTFALQHIAASERVAEFEFLLPVAAPPIRSAAGGFSAAALADVFARAAAPPIPADYPAALRALATAPLQGYLHGFIDLVVQHAGRYFILDYKSNDLGPRPEDYAAAALGAEMRRHHYFLQYVLYVLALHRHLRARLPDYDYERHVGGVFYLFLRALSPRPATDVGVFRDRPPRALIDALDALLGPAPLGDRSSGGRP